MPRKVVTPITGEKYHVFNRGVDKQKIFSNKTDYLRFYQSMILFNKEEPSINFRLAKGQYSDSVNRIVKVYAYCLLPNHYHLILEQLIDGGISEFIKRVSSGYTIYFNEKYDRSGVLFQGTYKRVHVDNDNQFRYLLAYVNENHKVHSLNIELDTCHTSSLHYQSISSSKLIGEIKHAYNVNESSRLAQDIYKKRTEHSFIFE